MKDYLIQGFKDPKHLYKAIKMKRKQLFFYFAFLALLITLSMTSILMSVMGALRDDGIEITETLPAFEITDSRLVVEEDIDSYVHQTESFLFFFDPNDVIQEEEIDSNIERLNVPIGIGFMDDQFYLTIMGQSLPVSYDQLDGLTDEEFKTVMADMGRFSPLVLLAIFIVTYLGSSFSLLYEWLIVALFGNILKTLFRILLPFRKVARMALVALSIPTLLVAVFQAFGLFLPWTFELTLGFSVYFLYASLRNLKKNRTV